MSIVAGLLLSKSHSKEQEKFPAVKMLEDVQRRFEIPKKRYLGVSTTKGTASFLLLAVASCLLVGFAMTM